MAVRNKSTRLYSILGAHFAALLVLLLSIVAAPAAAQPLATNAGRVTLLGLDRILGDGMSLFYSRGAETEAGFYATEVEAAVRWYRETLGWAGSVAMAVLSEADYRRTTAIPYPVSTCRDSHRLHHHRRSRRVASRLRFVGYRHSRH